MPKFWSHQQICFQVMQVTRFYPSFSANPPYRTFSFFSFSIHYMDFPDCLLLLLSISVFLLFSFSVFTLFSCRFPCGRLSWHVGFRAHVKIASRIVSYQWVAVVSAGPYASLYLAPDNHASTTSLSSYRPDALPAAQPTASKHWWQKMHK